jgi:hypothetical protein
MVVKGDICAWLVPVGSNVPLKEHTHSTFGSVCVEAEPNVEFWVGVKRIGASTGAVLGIKVFVDGQDLGRSMAFQQGATRCELVGLYSEMDGVQTMRALKFVTPTAAGSGAASSDPLGKVEILIYQAVNPRLAYHRNSGCPRLTAASVDMGPGALRTEAGMQTSTFTYDPHGMYQTYDLLGAPIDKITLYYGSAAGLVHCGVLPKPADPQRDSSTDGGTAAPRPDKARSGVVEVLDLTDSSTDDESDKKPTAKSSRDKKKRETKSSGGSGESPAKAWLKSMRLSLILQEDEKAKCLYWFAKDKKKEADLLEAVEEFLEANKIDVPPTDADVSRMADLKDLLWAAVVSNQDERAVAPTEV